MLRDAKTIMELPLHMKVLFLSGNASTPFHEAASGVDTAPDPHLLGTGLAARGITVLGAALTRFPLNPLARSGTFYAGFDPVRALRILLRDRAVDVIVGVGESSLACVLPIARVLGFPGPILLREISALGWGKRDRVLDYVIPRVDGILALTPHQVTWAQGRWPLKAAPDMVGFAIDESFFRPLPAADGGYVLAVGDDAGRDYECLFAACQAASWRLVLRANRLPPIPDELRGRVTVLDRVSYVELRELYAAAAVVIIPLQPMDSPSGITALFEGLAMGRPVVASRISSTQDIVRDGENGLHVPPRDPAALRAAVDALMDDRALAARLGAAARATIKKEQTYSAYVDRLAAALRQHVTRFRGHTREQASTLSILRD